MLGFFLPSVFGLVWVSEYFSDFQYYLPGFHHSIVTISITTLICVAREKQLTRYVLYYYKKNSSLRILAIFFKHCGLGLGNSPSDSNNAYGPTCRCPENLTLYPNQFHPYSIPGRPSSNIQFHWNYIWPSPTASSSSSSSSSSRSQLSVDVIWYDMIWFYFSK